MSMRVFHLLSLASAMALSVSASAETARSPLAEKLVASAEQHLGVSDLTVTSRLDESPFAPERGLTEFIFFELSSGLTFAHYTARSDGTFVQLTLNSPPNTDYQKARDRRALIENLIKLAAPEASGEERQWASEQLDAEWSERVRPLPVRIGAFVFGGITVRTPRGAFDKLTVAAVDAGAVGLECCRRLTIGGARPIP